MLAHGNYKLREIGIFIEEIECLTKTTVKVYLKVLQKVRC